LEEVTKMMNKRADTWSIHKLGAIALAAVGLLILVLIVAGLFTGVIPKYWGAIVDFFRFGVG